MEELAKDAEISFPATLTTADGLTHTVADADAMAASGLGGKTWERLRGGYREAGSRPYKDGRESVGRKMAMAAKAKPKAPAPPAMAAPEPPPEVEKPRSSRRRRSSSSD